MDIIGHCYFRLLRLISALAFNLMGEGLQTSGSTLTAGGFLVGVVAQGVSVLLTDRHGTRKGGMSITAEAVVLSSLFGLLLLYIRSVELSTFVLVVAAGTILAISTNVMVPEAYGIDDLTGLVITPGFLAAPAMNIFP